MSTTQGTKMKYWKKLHSGTAKYSLILRKKYQKTWVHISTTAPTIFLKKHYFVPLVLEITHRKACDPAIFLSMDTAPSSKKYCFLAIFGIYSANLVRKTRTYLETSAIASSSHGECMHKNEKKLSEARKLGIWFWNFASKCEISIENIFRSFFQISASKTIAQ